MEFFDIFFESFIHGAVALLDFFAAPISSFTPCIQIIIVSALGALLSGILAKRYDFKREKRLRKEFNERLSTLKYTDAIADKNLEKIVRSGIHQAADEVYSQILLDRFFDMGISYLFPMFFPLIWLEYSRFTPENLKVLTGSSYAWTTGSGLNLSAAWLYLFCFNVFLFGSWLIKTVIGIISKKTAK
jgi:uncharacterized membrane protein (DUF106 family)